MVLLLMIDGRLVEIPQAIDVAHKPGALICFDANGAPVASFDSKEILGYTLKLHVCEAMKDKTADLGIVAAASRKAKVRRRL